MDNEVMTPKDLIGQIREIMNKARYNVAREVNNEQLFAYWNIGRVIIEHEQDNSERAEYGKQTLKQLSRVLTKEFGKGFSRSNLQNMRAFYLAYPTARHCLAN